MTIKKYRKEETIYRTISLTLDLRLISELALRIQKESDQNMSRFIENKVTRLLKSSIKIQKRRSYKSYPIKKTFTFTDEFVKKIKASGNMSMCVESILVKEFSLNFL